MKKKNKIYCFLDYETFSFANIKKVGGSEYLGHETTEIVCVAWQIGTRDSIRKAPLHTWCGLTGDKPEGLLPLKKALRNRRIYKVAHNAGFDRGVSERLLGIEQAIDNWLCTAALAAAHALPRDLGRACDVLKLSRRKNSEGKKLINRYSKPKKPSKKDPSTRHTDRAGLLRFTKYCGDDVQAMVELFLELPPLTASEREVYKLNQRINKRGVNTDGLLIRNALDMIAKETVRLNRECAELTKGKLRSTTQREKLKKLLASRFGLILPNMQKKTLEDVLESGMAKGVAKRLIVNRQSISKTSTAKYIAFRLRTQLDGRVRDLQMYHGASTGRESGMGLQPHNLPKPVLKDVPMAIDAIHTGDIKWVHALTGNVMEALSSSIRGALTASRGHEMFAADFNAIEARVVLWLAGDTEGLKQFESGDPYRAEAAKIYGIRIEDVTDEQRAFGKAVVLGCGFQMGADKFFITCKQRGQEVTKDLAKRGVNSYRKAHPLIVKLWHNMEATAIKAVKHPGKVFRTNRLAWFVQNSFLYCQLPSGRKIAYYKPEVKSEMTPWGEMRPKLYFWYVHPKTNQWVRGASYGGELTENATQGTARDLMVLGQLRTEGLGYIPLFSVHDECVAEKPTGKGDIDKFCNTMAILPEWAEGLKVKVKGYKDERYRKD